MEKVFEYIVIHRPKGEGQKATILKKTETILAENEQAVRNIALMDLSAEHKDKAADLEVLVRPFQVGK